jgi:type I restriction enzyme, S subunit
MSELPQSWSRASFDETFSVISDQGRRLPESDYKQQGTFPVIDQGEKQIGGYTDNAALVCHGPFPLIIFGDHTRRVKLVEQPFVVGAQGIKLLGPSTAFSPKFLFYQFPVLELPDRGYSRHFQFVRKLQFITAPLPEQARIVAEIEKQFTRLDDAVAALKHVQANLKRYRASVLKAACEGRLVPTEAGLARKEGRDYEPASELLKRILAERRAKWEADQLEKMIAAGKPPKDEQWKENYRAPEPPDSFDLLQVPTGWTWASIDQLAAEEDYALAIGPFGSNLKVSDYTSTGVPLVFVRNIRTGDFSDDSSKFISQQKAQELRPHGIRSGDLLITKMGDPPGDVCIYPDDRPQAVITADCIKLRLHPFLSSKRFFEMALSSESSQKQILLRTKGVAQLKVSLARFKTVAVPLPPEPEQFRIAAEIERRFSILADAVRELEHQIMRANRLRQSILKRAFVGKVVPQDPSDEPASVLLERIRAERARAQEQKQKTPEATNAASPLDGQRRKPGPPARAAVTRDGLGRRTKKLAQPAKAGKG